MTSRSDDLENRAKQEEQAAITETQDLVDFLRGELDKEHGFDPGWSGPITDAYMIGYGSHPREREQLEVSAYSESLHRGWY